jgi:hypothetical protein
MRHRKPVWLASYRLGIAFSPANYRVRTEPAGIWVKRRFHLWQLLPDPRVNDVLHA